VKVVGGGHPHEKPIKLYRNTLNDFAKFGDKLLDTHLGSASSRIAAADMGFDFWGYELDEGYYESGSKRFAQFQTQTKLFPV
jgi:site-specific DNA-methyltransferase (adenine-specific)